jgi:hypothetical protein
MLLAHHLVPSLPSPTPHQTTTQKFAAVQRHRMFVRDPASQQMVGLVTVSDVLKVPRLCSLLSVHPINAQAFASPQ